MKTSTRTFRARFGFQAKVLIPVVTVMVLLIATAMWVVNQRITSQVQADGIQKLDTANKVFTTTKNMLRKGRFVRFNGLIREPAFRATLSQLDVGTISGYLEYIERTDPDADLVMFTSDNGQRFVNTNHTSSLEVAEFENNCTLSVQRALMGETNFDTVHVSGKLYQVYSLPAYRGAMTFGVEMNRGVLKEVKQFIPSEILLLNGSEVLNHEDIDPALAARFVKMLEGSALTGAAPEQIVVNGERCLCQTGRFHTLDGGRGPGYLLLSSVEAPLANLRSTQRMLFLVSLCGILAGTTVVWLLVRKVTEPLRQLRDSAEAVGRGDFTRKVEVSSRDECGELATVFNQMTASLKTSREELEKTVETLKATQHQLIQSEKLSGIGEFVAGVAHELNNPLTSVMGFSELLQQQADFPESQRRFLDMIFKSAKRCQKIVQSLLSFARRHAPERKVLSVNEIVESAVEILAYQMRTNNIQVFTELDAKLPPTLLDPHQMQQVFLNLINNARQAMEANQPSGWLRISTESQNGQVRIIFRDNGPGIPAENLKKIFNPFFTTKEVGKGTGLGLSLCYGIVSEHGGTITPHSRLGEGAAFVVELPITCDPAAKPEKVSSAPVVEAAAEGRGKKVLVIDDEESILQMIREALTRNGYDVDVARDGETALHRLEEKQYDLALCDWKMPGLNGEQIYERLRQCDPELSRRLIFITGDVVNEKTQEFLKKSNKICLSKPFALSEFRAAISRILATA